MSSTRATGIALAFVTALISGVAIFVNGHAVRHFGDATVWAGLWLIAAQHWIGALSFASPALMAWFLSFKTGKPLLEKQMARSKPGYADYMRRTSGFFPMPPKRT